MSDQLQNKLVAADTEFRTGRTAPKPQGHPLTRPQRPPELDDRAWLERQLVTKGQTTIAKELGVSYGAVRRACENLGIPPRPRGRRRGVIYPRVTPQQLEPEPDPVFSADQVIARRFRSELRLGVRPGIKLIASRFLDLGHASRGSNAIDLRDALISLAAGCALLLHELQQLEPA